MKQNKTNTSTIEQGKEAKSMKILNEKQFYSINGRNLNCKVYSCFNGRGWKMTSHIAVKRPTIF